MALKHLTTQTNSINMERPRLIDIEIKKSGPNRAYGVLKSAWDLARLFGKRTTIHGVNRLLGETQGRYERAVWFLTVILAFAGSIYVSLIISRRFNEGKFQTVVDNTRMPIYKVSFPVITICNLNRLNWARIEEAKQKFLPNETSAEKLKLFEEILGTYDDISFGNFDHFSVLEGQPLKSLNHVNFSLVVNFMTWRCEEFLDKCVWRHKNLNCCEIFSRRRSKNGPCWSFNTLETEEGRHMQHVDPLWPWRTGGAGPKSALKLRVYINPEKHYPKRFNVKGLSVMVTEPNVWHENPFRIFENTETMIEIEPVMYYYDNDTRSVSSTQRECVFEDERNSADFKSLQNYIYMYENCQAECHQEYLMRYCNCSMDLLFPPGQYPPCKAKDLLCLAKHNDHFLFTFQPGEELLVQNEPKGMECKCFLNCYSLNYVSDVRSIFLPAEIRKNVSYVDLDVHFRFDTLMVYRTSLVFSWVDLMVAFGGIAGLFLGCSLISAMELVYFAFIELPSFVFERIRCSRKQRNQLHDINTSQMQRSSYPKFGSFMQRNMANESNESNEYVFKNNAMKSMKKGNRYVGMQAGHLTTWERLTEESRGNSLCSKANWFHNKY